MTNLQARKIEELKGGFKGEILLPSDGAYESARKIWNATDRTAPRSSPLRHHVGRRRGVNFARDNGLLLAVRGGGHNIAGNALCDDGLVIDLSKMKAGGESTPPRCATIEGVPRSRTSTPPPRPTAWPRPPASTPPPASPD